MKSKPEWILSNEWAVSRDSYNWILKKPKGKGWRAVSFYPTPEMLLKQLHEKVSRTMPAETDLLMHIETAYKVGEALSSRLSEHIHATFGELATLTPQTAHTILKQRHG